MTAHREPGWVELLALILRGTPKLTGGLCIQRSVLFDADQDNPEELRYAVESAVSLCLRCPCLETCKEWAATQPRLCGVVAGEMHYFHDVRRTAS